MNSIVIVWPAVTISLMLYSVTANPCSVSSLVKFITTLSPSFTEIVFGVNSNWRAVILNVFTSWIVAVGSSVVTGFSSVGVSEVVSVVDGSVVGVVSSVGVSSVIDSSVVFFSSSLISSLASSAVFSVVFSSTVVSSVAFVFWFSQSSTF